ncbi:hypothetical protein CLDAP_27300 [Caldilinea aerophila DSM 14535 = NBRC 104270]|uniref:Uncharacterized protein n=1 Tax=Caldilinea aerophila (strain DSM 14535 / JCM 11387 / NBRC 104270 / STL-6-O1) TaxID=926550 RepID=I0I682_CALAS|nr:hypothetical protein CLDAP_27300 [Caldilinea aerophila DSM 14535 = NBRC 104270]
MVQSRHNGRLPLGLQLLQQGVVSLLLALQPQVQERQVLLLVLRSRKELLR